MCYTERTKRQNELFSEVRKLFSQSCIDVPAQLPSAMLPRQARGTCKKTVIKPQKQFILSLGTGLLRPLNMIAPRWDRNHDSLRLSNAYDYQFTSLVASVAALLPVALVAITLVAAVPASVPAAASQRAE